MNDKTQPAMELPALPEPMTVLSDEDIMRSAQGWRQFDAPEGLGPAGHMIYGVCRAALNAYYERARVSASSAAVGEPSIDALRAFAKLFFSEGFYGHETYNDTTINTPDEAWANGRLDDAYVARQWKAASTSTPPSAQQEGD